MFSVIRLEGCVNFFIGKVSQVLYFPSNAVDQEENYEEGLLRSFLLELKFSLVFGFKMMDCSRVSSLCARIVSLFLVKCRQGLSNCIKNPHCFVSVSFYV